MDQKSKIRSFISNLTQIQNIGDGVSLIENNLLDSFQIANLIAELENAFLVKIPGYKVNSENFNTVEGISKLIDELKA